MKTRICRLSRNVPSLSFLVWLSMSVGFCGTSLEHLINSCLHALCFFSCANVFFTRMKAESTEWKLQPFVPSLRQLPAVSSRFRLDTVFPEISLICGEEFWSGLDIPNTVRGVLCRSPEFVLATPFLRDICGGARSQGAAEACNTGSAVFVLAVSAPNVVRGAALRCRGPLREMQWHSDLCLVSCFQTAPSWDEGDTLFEPEE